MVSRMCQFWHVNISGSPRGKLDVIFVCIHSYSLESHPPLFYLPSLLSCTCVLPSFPSLPPSLLSPLQVSAWGGYVFIINLVPLHVFVLLLMGRYSNRWAGREEEEEEQK